MREESRQKAVGSRQQGQPLTAFCLPPSAYSSFIPWFIWTVTALVALGFVGMVVAAPLALASEHDFAALVIYKSFGRLCHQIPERSFYLAGHPLAVCARCAGIYFGFAGGVLLYPLARVAGRAAAVPARKWLLAAIVPTALDFALGFTGLWENTHLSRALTGALLGGVVAFYVIPGLIDMCRMFQGRRPGRVSIAAPLRVQSHNEQ